MTAIDRRLLKVAALKRFSRIPRFQELDEDDFAAPVKLERATTTIPFFGTFDITTNFKLSSVGHFISHKWESVDHPDPRGYQLKTIIREFKDDCLIWYDYACLPQNPRDKKEQLIFSTGIDTIPHLIEQCWFYIIGSQLKQYRTRAWCQFESFCALNFGTVPRTPVSRKSGQIVNHSTYVGVSDNVLIASYKKCYKLVPKTPSDDPYLGGYYYQIPDLDSKLFSNFKLDFFRLSTTVEDDKIKLWTNLRRLFPARKVDGTYVKY